MVLRRFELDNVRVVLEKTIQRQGKIFGLTEWVGKKATIIIQDEDNKGDKK